MKNYLIAALLCSFFLAGCNGNSDSSKADELIKRALTGTCKKVPSYQDIKNGKKCES